MFRILDNFEGGNIRLIKIDGDCVHLENDLRDNVSDWFYWAFCIENAAGRTLQFVFDDADRRVGPWGAAMSTDLKNWQWTEGRSAQGEGFTCTIPSDRVYLAHNMLYTTKQFQNFAAEIGLEEEVLTQSRKKRNVPVYRFGTGHRNILLTARSHACEGTGSYALEGAVRALIAHPFQNMSLTIVPFVDYDGVVDGDQGKCRAPFDHNRDYRADAIYPECRSLIRMVPYASFDFHSPNHSGGRSDGSYLVYSHTAKEENIQSLAKIFQKTAKYCELKYHPENDVFPNTAFNRPDSTNCNNWFGEHSLLRMSLTLETSYFGQAGEVFTEKRAMDLGRAFGEAIQIWMDQCV